MNYKINKIGLLIILSMFTNSCKNKKHKLDNVGFWKYSDGFYIGDLMNFNEGLNQIREDTIYKNEKPVALFDKIENRILSNDKVLHIKSLSKKEKRRYIAK